MQFMGCFWTTALLSEMEINKKGKRLTYKIGNSAYKVSENQLLITWAVYKLARISW